MLQSLLQPLVISFLIFRGKNNMKSAGNQKNMQTMFDTRNPSSVARQIPHVIRTAAEKAKLGAHSTFNKQHQSFASSNTGGFYVLIRQPHWWKWLEMYQEVVIVDNIKVHKEAFVPEFLQQFSQYCLCFNLISVCFTPLFGFYWGCACFIFLI